MSGRLLAAVVRKRPIALDDDELVVIRFAGTMSPMLNGKSLSSMTHVFAVKADRFAAPKPVE
jgi:hypothetical protein